MQLNESLKFNQYIAYHVLSLDCFELFNNREGNICFIFLHYSTLLYCNILSCTVQISKWIAVSLKYTVLYCTHPTVCLIALDRHQLIVHSGNLASRWKHCILLHYCWYFTVLYYTLLPTVQVGERGQWKFRLRLGSGVSTALFGSRH